MEFEELEQHQPYNIGDFLNFTFWKVTCNTTTIF